MASIGIERKTLWKDSIFDATFDDIDNDAIISFYESLVEKEKGVRRSNIGGWQRDVKYGECEAYDDAMDKCVHVVKHIFNDIYKVDIDIKLANSWLNSNNFGDSNAYHTHPGCIFSGVYYVNASKQKENGSINFIRPNNHTIEDFKNNLSQRCGFGKLWQTTDMQFESNADFMPQQNHAYLFPPWFGHEVKRNYSQENRLVIGMNFNPS